VGGTASEDRELGQCFAGLVGRFELAARRELVVRLLIAPGQLWGSGWGRNAAWCCELWQCSFLGVEGAEVVGVETNLPGVEVVGRKRFVLNADPWKFVVYHWEHMGCVVDTESYVQILDEGQYCTSSQHEGMGVSRWEMEAKRILETLVLHMGVAEDLVVARMERVACAVGAIACMELAALVPE
jgi:hypothetical protein